ncbi:hypothetical protein L916_20210, partial [Phytophthora nicotianae]
MYRLFQILLIREFALRGLKSTEKMVKPRGKVPRDFEVTGRDLSFKSVWRELKQDGWTRKPPPRSSLDDRYKYIRPEGHPNGTIGLNYLLGEAAVLDFYADVLRSRARRSIPSSPTVGCTSSTPGNDRLAAPQEVVRQSYLPDIEAADASATAANQGVGTVNAAATTNAEPPTPPDSSLPQRVATRLPARRSLETTETFRASRSSLIPTSPHVGDDSFKIDSDDTARNPEAAEDDASVASAEVQAGDEDNEDELDALGSELLADNNDDLNAIDSNESAHHVEAYCAPDDLVDDVDETEAEIAEEVLFAENCLERFGGADEVLAGNLKDSVLRSMSATGWEDVVEPDIYEQYGIATNGGEGQICGCKLLL